MMPDVFRLGEHEARIARIEIDVAEIKGDVKTLLATDERRKGGRFAVAALGGFIGAAAAFLANMMSFVRHG